MNNSYKVFPDDPVYKRNLKREIRFWNSQTTWNPEVSLNFQIPVRNYINEIIFGVNVEPQLDWQDFVDESFGIKGDILILGAGIGSKEEKFLKKSEVHSITIIDISDNSLSVLKKNFPDKKIDLIVGDLNFIELEENQFDFIICNGVLHHIINIEHLIYELKKSLKPRGFLVVHEYIGDNKWIWKKSRTDFINKEILPKLKKEYFNGRNLESLPLYLRGGSPFESIRAEEVLPVIREKFSNDEVVVEKKWGRIYYPILFNFPWKKLPDVERSNFLNSLIKLEKENPGLEDVFAFSIYQKKLSIAENHGVIPWSKKEVRKNIDITYPMPFKLKVKTLLKESFLYTLIKSFRKK